MAKQSRKLPQKVFPESYQPLTPPSNFLYTSKYQILKGLAWGGRASLHWSQRITQQNWPSEELSRIFPQAVISVTLYDLVPLFTHSSLYSRVNINTHVNSRCLKREGSHSPGKVLPAALPSQRTAAPFASSYLCRGADPGHSPPHRKAHTARPSAGGVPGTRSTQIHWCRLSKFHCRLPEERREKKNQSQICDVERPSPGSGKMRLFCLILYQEFKNLCLLPPETSQSLMVTTQHVPGCFSSQSLAISLGWPHGIPQPKVQHAVEKGGGSNPLQNLPKQAPPCW